MEEKSVEIPKIKGPLREQDSIRALLELLEQQGMEQEKGDVIRMADHIDTMEIQLGTVLKELGEVKKQLGVMQESKVKLFAVNTIQKAEHQVQTLRFQVGEWKRKQGKQPSLKDTLQELRQETATRQLGKEEKQKAAIR